MRLPRLIGDDLVEIDADKNEVRRIHTWKLFDPAKDPIAPNRRRWEWTHVNGLDVNAAGDIVFSARSNDRVGVIDASTHQLSFKFTKVLGQHHPTWLANGLFDITGGLLTQTINLSGGGGLAPLFNLGSQGGFLITSETQYGGTLGDFTNDFFGSSDKPQVFSPAPVPSTIVLGVIGGVLVVGGARLPRRRRLEKC